MELFLPFVLIGSKNLFNKSISNRSKDSKMDFRNRKQNYINRKWHYFSPFLSSDQKTYLIKVSPIGLRIQKGFRKQEMELSKQEMEYFLTFPVIGSKNFFNKSIPNWSADSKMDFRNRKWNYLNRNWNYFSPFQLSDQKTPFTKVSPIGLRISKWISQIGNGIISPLSGHWIKKLIYQKYPQFV